MKRASIIGTILVVLLSLSSCAGNTNTADKAVERSDAITLEGKPVSLTDFRGKPVLLNFWATWCPFCQAERPLIQQIYDEWQSRSVIVLTVDIIGSRSTESPENLASFMGNNKYTFPVLLDVDRAVTKTYNIKSTPHQIPD